ncbi:MAG: DMT family transporter [Succiniclasticum sp.]|jgi:drug/metabolite transporter (DMT)-like permease|nr:DMT family transporter [Succiniclasticum sp.]MEE3478855.1 DMT family transporter [Succiniclasticum sp.]
MKNRICLLTAALIWGTTFLFQRVSTGTIGTFSFITIRSLLGALAVLPILLFYRHKKALRARSGNDVPPPGRKGWPLWVCCVIIGCILFAGSALQQAALIYTTAGKAAFITALYIVLVPILGLVLYRPLRLTHVLGCALGSAGLYLLTYQGGGEAFNFGDLLAFAGVLFWALHIIAVDRFVEWHPGIYLADGQLAVDCVLGLAAVFLTGEDLTWQAVSATAIPLLYAGIMSSGVAYALQIIGQEGVPPTEASMLLSMEMIFGALSGALFLGETMTARELTGAAIMFAGVLTAQVPGRILWYRRMSR